MKFEHVGVVEAALQNYVAFAFALGELLFLGG
jgi:hypothetical protein